MTNTVTKPKDPIYTTPGDSPSYSATMAGLSSPVRVIKLREARGLVSSRSGQGVATPAFPARTFAGHGGGVSSVRGSGSGRAMSLRTSTAFMPRPRKTWAV